MATIYELSDPKTNYLFKPLLHGTGFKVCEVCYCPTESDKDYNRCSRCNEHQRSGYALADLVLPIAMAIKTGKSDNLSQYPYELAAYKDSNNAGAREFQIGFAAILWRWLLKHEVCLMRNIGVNVNEDSSGGALFDIVTSIPSTGQRPGEHPLGDILKTIVDITSSRYLTTLSTMWNSPKTRSINAEMFQLSCTPNEIVGKTILLIDDTWTSGANAQSAANRLKTSGATKVVILVLGRWMAPPEDKRFEPMYLAYVKEIKEMSWDWDTCIFDA